MILSRTNTVLAILLLLTIGLIVGADVDYTQPNVEFLPEMKRSGASNAYAANSVLPGGRTLQVPVPGTIPRGDLPLYYEATKEDAVRAGEDLQNPYRVAINKAAAAEPNPDEAKPEEGADNEPAEPKDDDSKAESAEASAKTPAKPDPVAELNASIGRGVKIYGVFCVSCHGPSGAGDGPVAKRGFPPPPPLPTGKSAEMKDGQLFHILTCGQGSMAPMAAQLTREQRWDVINYVRSLQEGAKQKAAAAKDDAPKTDDAKTDDSDPDNSKPSEKETQP